MRKLNVFSKEMVDTMKVCLWDGSGDITEGINLKAIFGTINTVTSGLS